MTKLMVLINALITVGSSAQEPRQSAAKRIPIDFSALPLQERASQDQEGEYMGRVYVLHSVLAARKDGVRDQVSSILPWIDADERIVEKWHRLVETYRYRIVPLKQDIIQSETFLETAVNPRRHELAINLKEGVYLESDPALLLVGSILDAEYLHRTQDFSNETPSDTEAYRRAVDDFFEGSRFRDIKNEPEVRHLVARTWMRRRTVQWQMAWYQKAVARNPMVRRPAFSRLVEQASREPQAFKKAEVETLAAKTSEDYTELLNELWDYRLPAWYDLPN